jgi:hypothetical protein
MNAKNVVVAALLAVGASQAVLAQTPCAVEPARELTRAEVLADLQIYQESGLAELDHPDAENWRSSAYRGAFARYAKLRNSPRFEQLAQQITAARGGRSVVC